jgi:serine/threonine protein phosphatase PrpC
MSSLATISAAPASAGRQAPEQMLAVRSFGLTHPGKVRPKNEDQFLIAELSKTMWITQSSLPQPEMRRGAEQGHLFLVADGMGGHQAGEQASSLTLATIEAFMLDSLKWFFHLEGAEEKAVVSEFQTALRHADETLFAKAARHPELQGMGTTLTLAYGLGSELFVVHVGDSRCYLLRHDSLHRLTRDHTLIAELLQRGVLSPDEAARHPYRHVITNCVGGHEQGVEVEAHKLQLEPGDAILLCSDGLTDMLSDDAIHAIMHGEQDPRSACESLVAAANEQGGKDNITVIVARFDGAGR